MDTKTVDIDVDTLEAGVELDLLVAEKVMGAFRGARSVSPMFYQTGMPCVTIEHEPGRISTVSIPPYSTDIRAAFELIKHVQAHNPLLALRLIYAQPYQIGAAFFQLLLGDNIWKTWRETEYKAVADTTPLAICRAALKAFAS
jgi:hypothetical protein